MTRDVTKDLSRPARRSFGRRLPVPAIFAGYLATVAAVIVLPGAWWWVFGVLASLAALIRLQRVTRNLSNRVDALADERERRVRDHAHRLAYWMMAGVIGALCGAPIGAAIATWQEGGAPVLTLPLLPTVLAAWGLFLLWLALPSAVIAFTERELDE